MMNNMRMAVKIGFGFGLVGLLFLLAITQYQRTLNLTAKNYNNMMTINQEMKNLTLNVGLHMLQARRAEKDFLLRFDMKYLDLVNEHVEILEQNLDALIALEKSYGHSDQFDEFSAMKKDIVVYAKIMDKVGKAWVNKGLDEKSGLLGKAREVAHRVEGRINEFEFEGLLLSFMEIERLEALASVDRKGLAELGERVEQFKEQAAASGMLDEDKRLVEELLDRYGAALAAKASQGDLPDGADGAAKSTCRLIGREVVTFFESHHIKDLRENYLQMRRHEKDYLLRGDVKDIDAANAMVDLLVKGIQDSGIHADEKNDLLDSLEIYRASLADLMAVDQEIVALVASMREAVHKLEPVIEKAVAKETEFMQQTQQETKASVQKNIRAVLILTAITVGIAVALAFFLTRSISRPLAEAVSVISSSSAQMASTVSEQERNAAQQAASVNEVNTTMNELNRSADQSTRKAEEASSQSDRALAMVGDGAEVVERTIKGMDELREKVSAIAERILELSEQINQIGSITNLVSDIAGQTNLLALNAAVEAARAGEHGKGFAVVSSEIRKLADESKKSAEKISALVAMIKKSTDSTVMVTEEGTKTVDASILLVNQTGQAFEEVSSSITSSSTSIQQIVLNMQQQVAAIGQVVTAMNAINAGAEETASGLGQTKTGVDQLSLVAEKLRAMV